MAWIKTNLRLVQFILKGSLNENQFTSNQTCLLLHGEKKILSDLFTRGALVDLQQLTLITES